MRPHINHSINTQQEIQRFLQRYRLTPHLTTIRTPSELLFGKTIRTTIDLLKPEVERQVRQRQASAMQNHDPTVRDREFQEGQAVSVRRYI